MKILFHKKFDKDFHKMSIKIKNKFFERLELFEQEPFHALLNNHSVDAAYPGWRSINITGNYRALFNPEKPGTVLFMRIGTHPELY